MTTTALLRAGGAALRRPAALAALSLRPAARGPAQLLQLTQRRGLAGPHRGGGSATSVTVRAVAAERPAVPAPASFGELGVMPELQVREGRISMLVMRAGGTA